MSERGKFTEPEVVGTDFSGQWIAWDDANMRIIAHSLSCDEVRQQAIAAGVIAPTLEFVPPADGAFVGGL